MHERLFKILVVALSFLTFATPLEAGWIDGGILVSSQRGSAPEIVPDGAGGVIIAWYYTISSYFGTIYAQKISANGDPLWGVDGVVVYHSILDGQTNPRIVPDGTGGVIVVWENDEDNNMIYAQRLNADGDILWGDAGLCICVTQDQDNQHPRAAPDGAGGAVISWCDGGRKSVHVQRVTAGGDTLWRGNGFPCSATANWATYPEIASDGAGGAIVAWHEITPDGLDVFVQRIGADGDTLWGGTGLSLCDLPGDQRYPVPLGDGAGGAFVVWEDRRNPGHGLYAQRIAADGVPLWQEHGVFLSTGVSAKTFPRIVPDGDGGAIIAWLDNRDWNKDVYAQRISGEGVTLWPILGIPICTEPTYQREVSMIADGAGGAIIAWEDIRSGPTAVYAQRVDADGTCRWDPDGTLIAGGETDNLLYPRLASDSTGGAVITWQDESYSTYVGHVFAQRFDAQGEPVATLLRSYTVSVDASAVEIEWELSEADDDLRFSVLRRDAAGTEYRELPAVGLTRNGPSLRYLDTECTAGLKYVYRVEALDESGLWVLFETDPVLVPRMKLTLFQNHPNPFNPTTEIAYCLSERCRVMLTVRAADGRLVARLVDRDEGPGRYSACWNGRDSRGREVASGIYFCRLRAGKSVVSIKMILAR